MCSRKYRLALFPCSFSFFLSEDFTVVQLRSAASGCGLRMQIADYDWRVVWRGSFQMLRVYTACLLEPTYLPIAAPQGKRCKREYWNHNGFFIIIVCINFTLTVPVLVIEWWCTEALWIRRSVGRTDHALIILLNIVIWSVSILYLEIICFQSIDMFLIACCFFQIQTNNIHSFYLFTHFSSNYQIIIWSNCSTDTYNDDSG